MSAQLHIQVQDLRGCVIARPKGELDLSSASALQGRLCALIERGHLVVDLSQTTFVDSTAIGAMIVAYRRGQVLGHTLRLSGAQGQVRKVLEITQIDVVLEH